MAQLFRVTSLNDSYNSRTFAFILPPALSNDDQLEIMSRDFAYGGHKWRLGVQKRDKMVCPSLRLIDVCVGVQCTLDLTLTLINRDIYTLNHSWSEKKVNFSTERPAKFIESFVNLDEINKGRFGDCRHDFLLELTLKQIKTNFVGNFRLTSASGAGRSGKEALDYQRYDAKPFNFGELEW